MSLNLLILYNDSCPSLNPTIKRINEVLEENNIEASLSTKLLKSDEEATSWKL